MVSQVQAYAARGAPVPGAVQAVVQGPVALAAYSTRTEATPRGEPALTVTVVVPPSTVLAAGLVTATVAGVLSTIRPWFAGVTVAALPAASVTTARKSYDAPWVSLVVSRLQV